MYGVLVEDVVAEYIGENSVEYVAFVEHVLAESVAKNLDEYGSRLAPPR